MGRSRSWPGRGPETTTITHRIACQVRSGAFQPSQILAVTFTEKAAGELRTRLAALGVEGVDARTFHSAALSQLARLWHSHTGEALPEVLDHKAPLISSLANALPPPHRFLPRRELAGEIEWAKNRMIPPARYQRHRSTAPFLGHTGRERQHESHGADIPPTVQAHVPSTPLPPACPGNYIPAPKAAPATRAMRYATRRQDMSGRECGRVAHG